MGTGQKVAAANIHCPGMVVVATGIGTKNE
jgi:hypothetical protein